MRKNHWIAPLAGFIALGAGAGLSRGEEPPAKSSRVLEIPLYERIPPYYQVTEADPKGRVRVRVRPEIEQFAIAGLAEGWYVMVLRPDPSPRSIRLVRVQVTEVDSPTTAILAVAAGESARLRAGIPCSLVRPARSTSAQLRALPDVIPVDPAPDREPSSSAVRQRAHREQSVANLKRIGLAIHNYHATYGHLPPAVIYGPDGKPWHSWRILLLPYLEENALFQDYDFRQPWDSPKNRKVLDRMPAVYRDSIHDDEKGHDTHYAALVGAWKGPNGFEVHTALPPSGMRMKDARTSPVGQTDPNASGIQNVTDGTSNTLVVAPVSPGRKIAWTRPEDITVGPDFPGLGRPGGIDAAYPVGKDESAKRAAPVLFLDGNVVVLRDSIAPSVLQTLTTRDGNEVVNFDALPTERDAPQAPPPARIKIHLEGDKTHATIE